MSETVRVAANTPALVVTLSVEGITSVVNVTENVDQPVVDASLSLDATTITGEKIDALPDDEESLLAYLQSLAGGEGNAQLIIDGFEGGRIPTRDQIAQIIIEPNSFNANGTGPRITIISKQPGPTRWAGNFGYRYRNSALNAATPGSVNKPSNPSIGGFVRSQRPGDQGKAGNEFQFHPRSNPIPADSYIKAITPAGPVNATVVSPSTYRLSELLPELVPVEKTHAYRQLQLQPEQESEWRNRRIHAAGARIQQQQPQLELSGCRQPDHIVENDEFVSVSDQSQQFRDKPADHRYCDQRAGCVQRRRRAESKRVPQLQLQHE